MTSPVQFYVSDLAAEVSLMERLASKFLERESIGILAGVRSQIENLKSSRQQITIGVDESRPIRTIACKGGYERNKGGECKDLYGEILFKWELLPKGSPIKKQGGNRLVEIVGIASSVARLNVERGGCKVTLASWRMEFGDSVSPGSFFHVQIPDTLASATVGQDNLPLEKWPHWLPVPRIPIPPITPMLALEFTLGEIFREEWRAHLKSGAPEVNGWRSLQKKRYLRYFEWQRKNVDASGIGSPLVSIIDAKPCSGFFLFK